MKPSKWIWGYIAKYKMFFLLAFTISLMTAGAALINPLISGKIVDEVIIGGLTDNLKYLVLIMVAVTACKSIFRYVYQLILETISQKLLLELRNDTYKRIQSQDFYFLDKNKTGDIMSRMTSDLDAIRHFVAYVVLTAFENIVIFIVAIVLMFTVSWQITLSILAVVPFIAVVALKQAVKIKPAFSAIREQFSKLNSVVQENISGNRIVKAFTRESYEIKKFEVENVAYKTKNIESSKIWIKYLPVLDFLSGILSVLVLLIGGILTIRGQITLGAIVTFNGYLWAVNNPLKIIPWLVNDTQKFVASVEKIYGMVRQTPQIFNPENPYCPDTLKGSIEFKDVYFKYDLHSKDYILNGISFKVEPGQTVAIMGKTGAGKTTLINLLARFYDVSGGAVLVDGIDVRKYGLKSLRSEIAYTMQDVFLFSDTIEGNVAYGSPDMSMEMVYQYAEAADARSFIEKTEEGFDTIIGERGVGLSGGQKQRIALSRALAYEPSILVLDDTTSAVDMETEQKIQKALLTYKDVTKLIIAQRISSVKDADLIIVLQDGKILETGTHKELILQNGYYFNLYLDQLGAGGEIHAQ